MGFGGPEAALLFKIKGDATEAVNAVRDVGKEVGITEKSFGGLGGQLSTLTPAIAAIGAAITALGAAAAATAGTLFGIAKNTAEYGSEIKDAADKTGLSTEALSALKVAADQSGSSLEDVANATVKFSKLVGDAAEGSKTAKESLIRLGVDPQEAMNDLDGALEKVFKRIAEARPGVEQTKLATEAFGKAGANIIPVIKSFDGDMAGLIQRAKELGVVFDQEAADAADEFGDTLDDLNTTTKGLLMTLGREFLPQITAVMRDLQRWLAQNMSTFRSWGVVINDVLYKLRSEFVEFSNWLGSSEGQFVITVLRAIVGISTLGASELLISQTKEAAGLATSTPAPRQGSLSGQAPRVSGLTDFGGGGKIKSETEKLKSQYESALKNLSPVLRQKIVDAAARYGIPEALAFAQLFSESNFRTGVTSEAGAVGIGQVLPDTATRVLGRTTTAAQLKNPEIGLTAWGEYMVSLFKRYGSWDLAILAYHQGEGTVDKFVKGKAGIGPKGQAYFNKIKTLGGFNRDELDTSREKFQKDQNDAEREAQQNRLRQLKADADQSIAILRAQNERELADLEEKLRTGEIMNSEYVRKVGEIRIQEMQTERDFQAQVRDDESVSVEARLAAMDKIAVLDEQISTQLTVNANKRKQALEEETFAVEDLTAGYEGLNEQTAGDADNSGAGKQGTPGGFLGGIAAGLDGMGLKVQTWGDVMKSVGSQVADVFQQIGQAVGNMVQQWVLMGSAADGSMRKMVASVLAGVAAQAATLSIFHLAMGIAALTPWGAVMYGPAPLHFKAAALWGTIAVATALAGRAVAGNAFKNQTSAATGANTQGSRAQGGAYSGQESTIEESGINRPSGIGGTIVIRDKSGMFDQLFEAAFEANGPMRRRLVREFGT